jgi:DNA-binding LacI/PurR family transcriptional regulator
MLVRMADAPPTIQDLAATLNISSTTVWRALNNSPRVSSKTRQRVLRAAKKLNYRPSLVAQTLLRGRTQTLGVVVPMIGNPVYASLVRAVEQVAFQHKYNIILCDTDFQLDREREYVDLLARRRVEGVAIVPFAARSGSHDYEHLTRLPQQGVAVVAMQQDVPGGVVDAILPDNRAAARNMTRHLLALGHRRIGFLHGGMPAWNVPMRERFDGYTDALREAEVAPDDSLILQAGTFESVLTDGQGEIHADEISAYLTRAERPTALFVPVDMLAIKVMEVARDGLGMRIPEDVAIAGFDDILAAAHTSPPLTTVRHPTLEVGRRAAGLLFEITGAARAANGSDAAKTATRVRERTHQRIPCDLVIRRSCGGGSPHAAKQA